MKDFTRTQYFTAIATGIMAEGMTQENIVAFANKEIELLAKRAAKAKETRAAKAKAPDAFADLIAAALTDEYQTSTDIVAAIGNEELTTAKATYRLNALVEAGIAVKENIKIEGSRGTRKGYKRA